MVVPAIPVLAWLIVAAGIAFALCFLFISLGLCLPKFLFAVILLGGPLGLFALYAMYRDVWKLLHNGKGSRDHKVLREE